MESAGTMSQSEQGVWCFFFLLLYFYLLLSCIRVAGEGLRRLVLTLAAASAAAGDDDDGATGVQKKKAKTEKKKIPSQFGPVVCFAALVSSRQSVEQKDSRNMPTISMSFLVPR